MKRALFLLVIFAAVVAWAADAIEVPKINLPPESQVTLNLSFQLPATHKVSPDAPLNVTVESSGAAIAEAPQNFKGKGKDLPYALTFTTAAAGEGTLSVKLRAFVCQKDNEGVCQMVEMQAQVPVAIQDGAEAAWNVPLPVQLRN